MLGSNEADGSKLGKEVTLGADDVVGASLGKIDGAADGSENLGSADGVAETTVEGATG